MKVTCVQRPGESVISTGEGFNRAPLVSNRMAKLPLGAIRAKGWLKHQLALMVEGMTGRLSEISTWLGASNGWFNNGPTTWDTHGWEEQPYWFRGFYSLAVQTGDARLLAESKKWFDVIFASQQDDGYFGPSEMKLLVGENGQKVTDVWPHMAMLDAIVRYYEVTNDPRVITLMTKFFEFCRQIPDEQFMPGVGESFGTKLLGTWWLPCIQVHRTGDMLPHIYWLYNRTKDASLLDLANRFYSKVCPPQSEYLDHHVVTFTQRYKYSGIYYAQSKRSADLAKMEYWYQQHMLTWGQQPRGIFGADEQIRPGHTDPRQGAETCAIVEFNKSFYLMGALMGDAIYADRCEDITFNHFPASQTPDLKGLHYITASNQVQLDRSEKHDLFNKGRQVDYSPHEVYRCCQHNVAMGWPWFAEHLWLASADDGLACWLYCASEIHATVGAKRTPIDIDVQTDYPFDGRARIEVKSIGSPTAFALYLRVPRWCKAFAASVNGESVGIVPVAGSYLRVERVWQAGDVVTIEMPMEISLTTWPRTGSVTVDRGPLSYSVKIGERWVEWPVKAGWPEWEVFPTTPWNYGLAIDPDQPITTISVKSTQAPVDQPWTVDGAPIVLQARAKRIPNWGTKDETVDPLPASPAITDEPEETIEMIPLGCARLRISCLPVCSPKG